MKKLFCDVGRFLKVVGKVVILRQISTKLLGEKEKYPLEVIEFLQEFDSSTEDFKNIK